MAATELNFGPEWLRALSDGVNKNSANNSNNTNNNNSMKSKMVSKSSSSSSSSCSMSSSGSTTTAISSGSKEIKYRYSKEEMLSYFNRSLNVPPPRDLMQHDEVFVEDTQNPLAFIEFSSDEINLLSQSINSDFVLKKSSVSGSSGEQNCNTTENSSGNVTTANNNNTNTYKDQINRMKLLNINTNSDLLLTRSSTSSERSKLGSNGFISGSSDRNNSNSYALRSGIRGGSIGERGPGTTRSALRNTNNIVFTRLSSMDDCCGSGSSSKSNSVFIAKKGSGLQRTSTGENNSGSSNSRNSIYKHPWHSGSISSSSCPSSSSLNQNNSDTKEWKSSSTTNNNNNSSNSEVLKSWRNDIIGSNNGTSSYSISNSTSKIGTLLAHKERKDFFGDSLDNAPGSDHEIIGGRKTRNLDNLHNSNTTTNNKSSKQFNRRFTSNSEQNDLFKSTIESGSSINHGYHHLHSSTHHRDHHHHSSHQHSYDGSMLDAERDLFGGRAITNQTASNSNYGELFSSTRATSTNNLTNTSNTMKISTLTALNRYRDHRDTNLTASSSSNYSDNSKFNTINHYSTKIYDRDRSSNSGGGSYHQRSSHQYDRFNNRSNNSCGQSNQTEDSDFFIDRFGGGRNVASSGNAGLASDEDDYRRNSLPEWSLEDPSSIDVTRVGTFDASGAFHETLDDEDDEENDFFKDEQCSTKNSLICKEEDNQTDGNGKINKKLYEKGNTINNTTTEMIEKNVPNVDSRMNKMSELRLETTGSTSKPKIDYFNDPSLSPNYTAKEETNINSKRLDNTNHKKENNNLFVCSTNSSVSANVIGSDSLIVNSDSVTSVKSESQTRENSNDEEDIISKRYNNLLMKDDDNNNNGHLNPSDFNNFNNSNQTQSNYHGNTFINESRFSMISVNNVPPTSIQSSNSLLVSNLSETENSPTFKSTSTLFSSLLNTNNHDVNTDATASQSAATTNQINEDLLNDQLKLSSLFNDFNFDFSTTGSTSSSTTSVPVATSNSVDQLFLRLTSTSSPVPNSMIQQNNHNMVTSFMNNNGSQGAGIQTFQTPSSTTFDTSNMLNITDSNADQQPFCGQRFSNQNFLSHSSVSSVQTKQISLTKDNMIQSNRDESNHHSNLPMLATKWLYCDPQGQTQGPFTSQEMYDWYNHRYFSPELLVKRATDTKFTKLGELIQACGGQCPFIINMPAVPSPTSPLAPPQSQPTPPIGTHTHQSTNFSMRNDTGIFTNFLPNETPVGANPQPSQVGHSASIVSPMINQFLSSQTQSSAAPTPNLSSHTFGPASNSFQMDDSFMNSFGFFQNIKQDSGISLNMNCTRSNGATINSSVNSEDLLASNDHLIDLIQQHQRQPQNHSQSAPPPDSSVVPIPPNSLDQENQMKIVLNYLIQQPNQTQFKDEFLALNTQQQREQYVLEKIQQFNLTHNNKDQLRQALNDQYNLNQCLSSSNTSDTPTVNTTEMSIYQMDDDQVSTASSSGGIIGTVKKLSLDESTISRPVNDGQLPLQLSQPLQRTQSYEPSPNFVQTHVKSSFQKQDQQDLMVKEDPLQLLKKYATNSGTTAATNTPWISENFVPGALSVTDVEEIQRREAEERYRNQQQQTKQIIRCEESDYIEVENDEFIEVDRKQKHRQQQSQKQNQKKNIVQKDLTSVMGTSSKPIVVQCGSQQQQISPQPARTPPANPVIISQMPQLPKKAVWGNPITTENLDQQPQKQPLSIAEIQRLQEEKEEEERRQREIQQMNALVRQQQQQRSMKWASQTWQEQNNSNIKTLAEIQAEEAEKQATLVRQQQSQQQQEMFETANRRRNMGSMTPLSVIVAKGNQSSAWNNNGSLKPVGVWDEEDQSSHLTSCQQSIYNNNNSNTMSPVTVTSINYKNAVAAGQKLSTKIESASLRQMLKTNPKVIKKIEDSQIMKINIETHDDLLRFSIELLNKHFDSIDAPRFMSIVKDLASPYEVSEYCQSYLGNNPVSMLFSKFFIAKKFHLLKMKRQEQERNKQPQKKNNWNNNPTNNNDDDDDSCHQQQRVTNYKLALNNNCHQQSSSAVSKTSKNLNNHTTNNSVHVKTPVSVKTLLNKSKCNDDVNMMTMQVESMEEFDKWCLDVLKLNFELDVDAETFINFLKDIASPDEINDYVQTYLGSDKTSRDFAKNFISKRSYLRNKAKKPESYEDMCGPAPALTPLINSSNNDNNGFVTVSTSNKKKRSKNKNQNHQNE